MFEIYTQKENELLKLGLFILLQEKLFIKIELVVFKFK